jgi:type IX secretion system PorP/SprF family membrane protein
MIRQLLFFGCLGFLFGPLQAQDPVFTQFYAAPVQLNPALTGSTLAPRIALNYRNQWPALNAYVTYAASYEQFVEELNSGFGVMLMTDDQGEGLIKSNYFKALYSYRVRVVDDLSLKIGVEAGFSQIGYDWDRFVFLDQIDKIDGPIGSTGVPNPTQEQRPDNTNVNYFDIGAGLVAYSKYFYAGVAIKHLTRPEDGLLRANDQLTDGLPLLYSIHAGTEITLREGNNRKQGTFISPNIMFIKQADFGQINGGMYGGLGPVFAGAWYRHAFSNPDAVMFLVGFRYDVFKIGYSYDLTVSELAVTPSGGAHEISLILNLENSEKFQRRRRANRYNDCFQLFR